MSAIANTKVWHEGKCFQVSTINRESSAMYAAGSLYAETLVWELDAKGQRGSLVGQDEAPQDSIYAHQRMVKRLHETGQCEAPDTNEREK